MYNKTSQLLKEKGKPRFIIKITGYYITIILSSLLALAFIGFDLSSMFLSIRNNSFSLFSTLKSLILLIPFLAIPFLILKLAIKKIFIYDDCMIIDGNTIRFDDILSFEIVEKNYSVFNKNFVFTVNNFRKTSDKEKFLKIYYKNSNSISQFLVGQYSLKNLKKLINFIALKTNCDASNLIKKFDIEQRQDKIVIIILVAIITILLTIFFIFPMISHFRKQVPVTTKIERNIEDDTLYDDLELDIGGMSRTTVNGKYGIVVSTPSDVKGVKVGQILDLQARSGGVYCLKLEKIERSTSLSDYSYLYFIGSEIEIDYSFNNPKIRRPLRP